MIIGIDPGKKGSIAVYNGKKWVAHKIPLEKVMGKERTNLVALTEILKAQQIWLRERVWLESVHAMPGQGVTSMFSFGRSVGQLEGIIIALGMGPINYVTPQTWQKALLGPTKGRSKELALEFILSQFSDLPHWMINKRGKVIEQYVDAMCIAYYGFKYGKI